MVGTEIAKFSGRSKTHEKLGCELGNHTYDHKDLATLSSDEISSEIARVDEQLVNLTGEGASVVRPPYGSVNDTVKSTVGTPMILWSIDTLDWKTQDVESTVEEVMNNVKDGSIILMHDIFSTSVDAAEILIPQLIEEGYQLVTVHELASLHQTELSTELHTVNLIESSKSLAEVAKSNKNSKSPAEADKNNVRKRNVKIQAVTTRITACIFTFHIQFYSSKSPLMYPSDRRSRSEPIHHQYLSSEPDHLLRSRQGYQHLCWLLRVHYIPPKQ